MIMTAFAPIHDSSAEFADRNPFHRVSTAELSEMVGAALPGPELALLLAELVDRLDRAPASTLVDAVLVAEQLSAWTAAAQSRALARLAEPGVAVPMRDLLDAVSAPGSEFAVSEEFRQRAETEAEVAGDPAWQAALKEHSSKFAAAEIGAVMTLSPVAARARVDRAVDLVGGAGCLVDAMECGLIDSTRARVLAEATRLFPEGVRAAVLDHLFPIAMRYTPSRLRAAAVRLAIRPCWNTRLLLMSSQLSVPGMKVW